MAAFDDVLLHKTKQKAMLRTSLNTNLTDFREMEFEIRKQAPVQTDHSAQTLLKDHYARNILFTSGRPTYSNLAIPLKHRRDVSKDRPQNKYLRPKPLKSIFSAVSQTESSQTPRTSVPTAFFLSEPRMSLQEERSDGILGLQEHIDFTQGKLMQQSGGGQRPAELCADTQQRQEGGNAWTAAQGPGGVQAEKGTAQGTERRRERNAAASFEAGYYQGIPLRTPTQSLGPWTRPGHAICIYLRHYRRH